jgi:hypothetical protein
MAAARDSIPYIALVVFNLVFGQDLAILVLERHTAMMFALVGDVIF